MAEMIEGLKNSLKVTSLVVGLKESISRMFPPALDLDGAATIQCNPPVSFLLMRRAARCPDRMWFSRDSEVVP